jgi:hypothetical protein
MKVFRDNLLLSTMGRGFWVLDDLPTLRQLPALAKADSPKILPIGKVQRIHSYPERGVPEYPVTGVKFFYYLPEKANAPLSLDIMNAGGEVIRSFTSVSKADRDKMPSEPDMATGFVQRGYSGALSGKAGLHEFQWDFRHDGAWTESGSSRRGSPMAAPGNYRIRLQIGDKKLEELFVLEMDPRVSESGVTVEDLKAQEALALQVRNLMSRANQLDAAVKKALKKEEDNKVLKALDAGLNTAGGRYQVPQLLDQISYLSSMLSYADQRPGQDAYDRYEELRKWFEDALEDWVEISGESAEMYKLDDD